MRKDVAAIRDTHIPAAIDIHAVTVRINLQIVDCEIVDTGRQNSEVPAVQNGKVAKQHISAILQRDRFVRDPSVFGHRPGSPAAAQPLTPDQARP